MGIQVTLVPVDSVRMALQALLGHQDTQVERVPPGMSSLPGKVLLAHLASLGLRGPKDLVAFAGAPVLQVSYIHF